MRQASPIRKPKRLSAYVSAAMHDEFMDLVDRSGESAGTILRGLVSDTIVRGRRGEPLTPRLGIGAPAVAEG